MTLHEDDKLFDQAIRATAEKMGIPDIYIEKDYWVTYALHAIFHDEIGKQTVFKGGTALSKCFDLIQRFSEDIDLVVMREEDESDNQLKNKIKRISTVVKEVMPEETVQGLTQKMGMNRKTAHTYKKKFKGKYGQVRDVIVVEATWLGYFEPYVKKTISSYVYDMMLQTGQEELVKKYGLEPFEVFVLDPRRSICEKIMSLVRFSYTQNPEDDLKSKIRHTYDLCLLLRNKDLHDFVESPQFDELLLQVANDDVKSYRNNNEWLVHPPQNALIFKDVDTIWEKLESTYSEDFKNLVYGELPEPEDILETFRNLRDRMKTVEWQISIPNNDDED